ncbi:IS66 family insertion sequence element accessory protein TnpA [Ruminiclostridium cellobioparum]|uniref:IS66 family insertion sequence element accessory protein TnpA n=1 Tax=Ruminiclostridium cellobioparum TaxID=29355 RepID=UPI0012B5862B|nr:hypothetical protein [Ruminiclostridium cellobioparum]
MDTRLATTNIRIQQWAAVFKAKAELGLTVDEYCDQNGITRNAYYYWLRRARAKYSDNLCGIESSRNRGFSTNTNGYSFFYTPAYHREEWSCYPGQF